MPRGAVHVEGRNAVEGTVLRILTPGPHGVVDFVDLLIVFGHVLLYQILRYGGEPACIQSGSIKRPKLDNIRRGFSRGDGQLEFLIPFRRVVGSERAHFQLHIIAVFFQQLRKLLGYIGIL